MISLRGKSLNAIVACLAHLTQSWSYLDLIKRRNNLDTLAKFISYRPGKKFRLAHMLAEWVYFPHACDRVVLYLHGGAFVLGSVDTHHGIMAKIAKLTCRRILGINYRLAPEHPFPISLEDSVLAYEWLLQQNIPAKHIIIAGDSAGGNLAIATALSLRDKEIPLPAAIATLSPWLDLSLSGASIFSNAKTDPLLRQELALLAVKGYLPNH